MARLYYVSGTYPKIYIARRFVILGYIDGEAPHSKPINKDRIKIVE